jgi:hypothetical protein
MIRLWLVEELSRQGFATKQEAETYLRIMITEDEWEKFLKSKVYYVEENE